MFVRIVGIGASAGGLQALETFFSEVPGGLGVAFVVVQHLSLDHASSMTEILQRVTPLRVESLNGPVVPRPNTVYVKMPEVDVTVEAQSLRTTPREVGPNSLYLPIDDFFLSLATSRKEQAVAIILSGMGTDGSRGLKEIKSQGGLVMVQSPDSAQFDGMPKAALRQNLADIVSPPGELANQLANIIQNTLKEEETNLDKLDQNGALTTLFDRIKATARIDFNHYRPATIMRRIEKRMLIRQVISIDDYISEVLTDEKELQLLHKSFLIGVTRFFRDRDAFRILREEVLPQLFERNQEDELRIWVPACSTGEEAYSIAMEIREYLRKIGSSRRFKIFASDVDRAAIFTAADGLYDESIVADVSYDYLNTYFTREPIGYRVRPELKEHILFAVQNLLEDPPFIRIDLISCRNFLIYVTTDSQQKILSSFHFSLNPSGCLILGPSESLGGLTSAFTPLDRRWKVFRKRSGARADSGKPIAPSIKPFPTSPSDISIVSTGGGPEQNVPKTERQIFTPSLAMDFYARYLSERHAPATLFVNQQYDILYLHGDLDGILRLPRYHAHLSLHTVVGEEAVSLLVSGVDRALTTGKSGVYERVNVGGNGQSSLWVRVRFSMHRFDELNEPVAELTFYPLDEGAVSDTGEDEVYSVDVRLKDKVRELETELMRSEQRAQKLYNELEATNEELQSSNRELLASNEEMQSTNEELQSVNEELYTVNSEFQRKNEELNNINNDVSNLLKSTQISTVFVDEQLQIRRFTPGIGQQFDLHSSDIGRPITSFSNPFTEIDIAGLCTRVLKTSVRHDEEIQDRNGNFFLLRVLPYLTDQDEVRGVVITFVDINDLVRTRRRLTGMALKYAAIFNNTEEVIAIVKENSRVVEVNKSLAGRKKEDLQETYFTDLITEDADKVKFNDAVRRAFNEGTAVSESITLTTNKGNLIYTDMEIIPIGSEENEHESVIAMVIIHDITRIEEERQETLAIINKYRDVLQLLERDAGLIDLEERLIALNAMPSYEQEVWDAGASKLEDFLTEAGLARYRAALDRIKQGSSMEEVDFPLNELTRDDHPVKVLYRPIYGSSGNLAFINFERLTNNAPSDD
jgi:two-component system CheB/CheR fusion protein